MSSDMKLDHQKLKRWREERCWSQDHLAATSGLSLRTIQRLERGESVSRDSARALAAAYGVSADALIVDPEAQANALADQRRQHIMAQARLAFLIHLLSYIGVMGLLLAIDLAGTPGRLWTTWPGIGWGVGVFAHGATVLVLSFSSREDTRSAP